MPQVRKYASDADRIAAFRERKRIERAEEEARIRAEQRRKAEMQRQARIIAGRVLSGALDFPVLLDALHIPFGASQEEVTEMRALVKAIGQDMSRGW